MYNSGRRGKRTSDGYGIISTADNFNQNEYPIPTVTSFAVTDGSYNPLPDTAVDTAGGQTIVIYGSGFRPGATVMVGSTTIGAVSYLDQGRLAFTAPTLSSASYTIFVINSNGGTGILLPGLVYSGVPSWTTSAGNIGSVYETKPIAQSFVATGDAPLTYALYSGTLPSGATLGSDGTLSGTAPADSGSTTYSFTIRAYDAQNQHSDRSFSLTINTDVVTWSNPTNNQVISAYEYRPITNVTASATSAAGYGVLYTANAVPGSITVNANTGLISGSMGIAGNTYTQLTATSNTTTRNATRNVVFNSIQDVVTWTTPNTNQVITSYEYSPISNVTANASSAAGYGVLYSSNIIPTGVRLDANTGLISGTANTAGNTYARLTATANTSSRSNTQDVIFNVQQDVVTWSSPADQTLYSVQGGVAISNVTLSATSAAGRSITYTANALPSGVGISGSVIYGTPDAAQTVTTLLTATASTTNRSATRTISWTVALGDSYLKNTSLLLNTSANTFIVDSSLNNYQFTVAGDTRPNNFSPFGGNYYSNFFVSGSSPYLQITGTGTQFGSGDFTIECWIWTNNASAGALYGDRTAPNYSGMKVFVSSQKINVLASQDGATWVVNGVTSTNINMSTWNHIALTRSGTNMYCFVNGARNTLSTSITGSLQQTSGLANIGADVADGSYFNGYISNYRIVKGTALYTTAFTPSTTPLTTTSQGATASQVTLLTCQSNSIKDNSNYNLSITKSGDIQCSLYNPFTTLQSSTFGSTYFDGTGDALISTGSANNFDFGSSDWTIEFWVYTTSSAEQHVFSKRATTASYSPIIVGILSNKLYILGSTTGSSWDINPTFATGTITIPIGSWTHIAVVRSGSAITGYVNGVGDTGFGGITAALMTNTTAMTIGAGTTALNNPLFGYVSDFRIIKGTALYTTNPFTIPTSTLTAVANTSLLTCQYNGGVSSNGFVDTSGLNNILNKTGNTSRSTFTPYGDNWSYYFNTGNPTLLSTASSNLVLGSGDWTIEAWVFLNSVTNGFYVASNRYTNGTGNADGPLLMINAGKLYARDATGALLVATPTTFVTGTWYHVALCRSGNNVYAFINGTQEGTTFTYSSSPTYVGNQILMGYEAQFATAADTGYVSNLRVIKGNALYTANFTPSTTPLTTVANTQLLVAQTNRIIDQSVNYLTFTRTGDISTQKFSPFGSVIVPKYFSTYFDGTGDYLTVPYSSSFVFDADFTVEAWFYFTSHNAYGGLFAFATTSLTGWQLIFNNTDNTLLFEGNGPTTFTSATALTPGQWNHVALTRSGSSIKLFINGVLDSNGATSSSTFDAVSPNTLKIGNTRDVLAPWNGYISNLRIVKGTSLYNTNFTPSTTPLTAVANTQLLTCQSDLLIDNSNNNFTITVLGDTIPRQISPFTPTASISQDYDPSVFGTSVYFDGNDYIKSANNMIYSYRTADFTYEAWTYFNSTGSYGNMITFTNVGTTMGMRWGNGGFGTKLQVGTLTSSATCYSCSALQADYSNTWVHVAFTRQANTCRLFLNGTQQYVGSGVNPGTYPANTFTLATDFGTSSPATYATIGGSTGVGDFRGNICDARLIVGKALYTNSFYPPTTPLTASKSISGTTYNSIFTLGNTPIGIYDTTRTMGMESVGNTQIVNEDPYGGTYYSNYFDGTGDYLTVPYNAAWSLSGDFTIECWLFWNTHGSYGGIVGSADTNTTQAITSGWFLDFNSTTNNLQFEGQGGVSVVTTNTIPQNQWVHIAVVRSGSTITHYLNGVPNGTGSSSTTFDSTNQVLKVGVDRGTSAYLNGNISNLRIVKGSALYTSSFTPSTTPLTAVSGTQLLTCQSNKFIDNSTNAFTITRNGDTSVKSANPFRKTSSSSIYFDGAGDWLFSTSTNSFNFGTGDFTIECWFNQTNTTAGTRIVSALTPYTTGNSGFALYFVAGYPAWYNSGAERITGTTFSPAGTWNHLAVVRSNGVTKLYVNGTITGSPYTDNTNYTGTAAYVGSDTTQHYNGYIKDFRVSKGVARYTTTFTPPTTILPGK